MRLKITPCVRDALENLGRADSSLSELSLVNIASTYLIEGDLSAAQATVERLGSTDIERPEEPVWLWDPVNAYRGVAIPLHASIDTWLIQFATLNSYDDG